MGKAVPEFIFYFFKAGSLEKELGRDPSPPRCVVGNSGASYRNILVAEPFQEAGRLARHQMFATGYKELQSKPFRRKLLL